MKGWLSVFTCLSTTCVTETIPLSTHNIGLDSQKRILEHANRPLSRALYIMETNSMCIVSQMQSSSADVFYVGKG